MILIHNVNNFVTRDKYLYVNLISYFEVYTFSGAALELLASRSLSLYHVGLHSAALCPSFDSVAFCYPLLKHLTLHLFACDNIKQQIKSCCHGSGG